MPRAEKTPTIEDLIAGSVERVVQRMFSLIERQVDRAVAAHLAVETKAPRGTRGRRNGTARPRARAEISTWIADRRARRVPNFVIQMTSGLDTKKKIVARFGENVRFEKGKPLPPAQAHARAPEGGGGEAQAPRAKPPTVRKAAAAR